MQYKLIETVYDKVVYIGLFILVLISFFLDKLIYDLMKTIKNPFFDAIFSFANNNTVLALAIIFMSVIMLHKKKHEKWLFAMFSSLILSLFIVIYLKFFFMRERPNLITIYTIFNLIDYSFPSGHTALAFSLIPILDKSFGHYKLIFLLLGIYMGFSRIYLGFHHFSDVCFGALLGFFIGEFIIFLENRFRCFKWLQKKILD